MKQLELLPLAEKPKEAPQLQTLYRLECKCCGPQAPWWVWEKNIKSEDTFYCYMCGSEKGEIKSSREAVE